MGVILLFSRASKIEKQEVIKVDRITKKILSKMELGSKVLVYNSPLDLSITIEKSCEIKDYNGRKVVYDLKKFTVIDNGESKPFREIEFTDIDTVKKYVSSLYEARLSREVKYIKLLMLKNICIGDVVKRKTQNITDYLVVQPFEETQADRFIVNCLSLDENHRVTDKVVKVNLKSIRRMKSIKIKK